MFIAVGVVVSLVLIIMGGIGIQYILCLCYSLKSKKNDE